MAARWCALSMQQAVYDLEALRVTLGHERWVFAGGSAGGFVGLHYALMFPGSLQALILVGTAPSHRAMLDTFSVYHPDHPSHTALVSAEMEPPEGGPPWTEVVWPLFSHVDGPVIEAGRRAGPIGVERFRALTAEMPHYDLEAQLGELDVPTLVIHGRHDASMPIAQGEILGQGIPGAELVIATA